MLLWKIKMLSSTVSVVYILNKCIEFLYFEIFGRFNDAKYFECILSEFEYNLS